MASYLRRVYQTLSGQNVEEDADSGDMAHQGPENGRDAATPAAASSSRSGPAGQEGHAQRQRILLERLHDARRTPLPSAAGQGQQDVEQELPSSLIVTVCDKDGALSAAFNLQHVEDLLPLLSGQDVYSQLLGPDGGLVAADFYAACVTTVIARGDSCGYGFVLGGPETHRLLRLELLAARAGLMLQEASHPVALGKTDAVLSEGAAKLFSRLWRHDNGGKRQGKLCEDLVKAFANRPGASAGSLENVLRKAYQKEYTGSPSKAPKASLKPLPADQLRWQQRPLEEISLLLDGDNAQGYARQEQQQEQEQEQQQALPQQAQFVPAAGFDLIRALQAQVRALEEEVQCLKRRVQVLEIAAPV
ncbi:hypothetical protein C2E21_1075 [Chlorella sorokiniana]|uniref:Uncharacterized protein n=1 Tax=Chlorella sorokiniana TaxID=3076 RepID=A0A2P6U2G2_CHLSO|nr:hypothetical protein C2E21_1075 [Chlorella sorokiniana]|eukprot:PRW60502.1 hypothetical protein C2E21_1075 [Chlorella sorokiniana]